MLGEHLAEQRLGRAAPVDVGRVDEVDARVERGLHARLRLLALDPPEYVSHEPRLISETSMSLAPSLRNRMDDETTLQAMRIATRPPRRARSIRACESARSSSPSATSRAAPTSTSVCSGCR